ncbi:hypothetical protein F9B74_00315 [Pelistega sp. NLN82]|uniref:Lipoprotein n=1 Tax=Pelistega ratti TaxID=2652177 RepID=A0A6L9Y4R2_9BURK|nr:hypothetical protein [Pelistega ratti]NEN74774.1 hypothetical protein [Pelistega ratti]
MKKIIFPLIVLLAACTHAPVDETKTAECAQIMGHIIKSPTVKRNPGENFLAQYQENTTADAYRVHARRAGCIE